MHPLLNTAVKAARQAGRIILRHLDRADSLTVTAKGRNDFVTEVDRAAESEIIDIIRAGYPDHGILAEESGSHSGDRFEWIIDPLDGTTNFLHGFPQFAVSIAIRQLGRLEHGVIFDPLRNELFTASRGKGAQLNDRRIRVSRVHRLDGALLATGFPFKDLPRMEVWIDTFRALLPRTSGVRRAGSAALDLAYVAAGRCDGFWEFGLNIWDIAAGALLIEEAGGLLTDPAGGHDYLVSGDVVAANAEIQPEMLRLISAKLAEHAAHS